MAREYKLTHERLLEVLDFDPETGVFVWKVARSNRVKIGSRAGVHHIPSGGRYIAIDNEKFMAHRLAFFYVNKRWPNTDVRPLDGDYDNSAIANLKEIQRVELAHRRGAQTNNTSGYLGVSKTNKGKWQATLTWNYRQFSLGANFESPEAAHEAREEAVRRFAGTSTDAEYGRVMEELRIWKGQRTAWRFLNRDYAKHGWNSFEEFCSHVAHVPVMRYAMVPLDAAKLIGPENYRWAYPDGASRQRTPEAHTAARRANRHADRNKELQKQFGIDMAEYERMLAAQNYVCAICEQPEKKLAFGTVRALSVDHNHTTGAVRGLLCANCNLAVGYACDDPMILRSAAVYLEKYDGVEPSTFDLSVTAAMTASPHRDWLSVSTLGFGA